MHSTKKKKVALTLTGKMMMTKVKKILAKWPTRTKTVGFTPTKRPSMLWTTSCHWKLKDMPNRSLIHRCTQTPWHAHGSREAFIQWSSPAGIGIPPQYGRASIKGAGTEGK